MKEYDSDRTKQNYKNTIKAYDKCKSALVLRK